jgi:hypothetical protein
MTTWKLVLSAALLAGVASASEPTDVQDPPGKVDVDQPAGVSLPERNTDRDSTDTLRGGSTDVIDGERSSQSEVRASESWRHVEAGTEARASFETETRSGAGAAEDIAPSDGAAEGTSESTSLGTDTGHGTGTEPVAPPPAR